MEMSREFEERQLKTISLNGLKIFSNVKLF